MLEKRTMQSSKLVLDVVVAFRTATSKLWGKEASEKGEVGHFQPDNSTLPARARSAFTIPVTPSHLQFFTVQGRWPPGLKMCGNVLVTGFH